MKKSPFAPIILWLLQGFFLLVELVSYPLSLVFSSFWCYILLLVVVLVVVEHTTIIRFARAVSVRGSRVVITPIIF